MAVAFVWGSLVHGVVQRFAVAFCFFVFVFGGSPRAATLTGDLIQAQYFSPDTSTIYLLATPPAPFVVGAGEEGIMLISDDGGQTTLHFDFGSNSLLITLNRPPNSPIPNPTWSNADQNGPAFTIQSGNPFIGIASVAASNLAPISAFLSNTGVLFINWAGMSYKDGDTVSVTFTPLPATLPLFAAGLGALGLLGWRRKRQRSSN